jgi:sugar phosphate isomerase/epimerase
MRLACADDTFRLFEHDHILELIRMLGLEGVDLCLMQSRSAVRPEDVRADVAGWADRLDKGVRGRGLVVADVFVIPWTDFRGFAPNHPDPAEREAAAALFRDMLELAARLGSPGMTILPGIDWEGEGHEESLGRAAAELAWRVEEARFRGVRLSIEPHVGSVASTPGRALDLLERTPGLELTLDYSHFVYQGIPEAEVEPLVPYARHCHVRGARKGRMQAPLRESTIDFERMLDVMIENDYDGFLGLEYVWLDWEHCNECDNLSETILLRDRLRAKLEGRPWSYPEMVV